MTRFVDEFDRFLDEVVNLSPGRLNTLKNRVEVIDRVLRNVEDEKLVVVEARPQGSAAQGTIINPRDMQRGFDADVLVECEDNLEGPRELLKRVERVVRGSARHADMVRRGTRCVTLDYAGEFHLDLVPCVRRYGALNIANRQTNRWETTDPDGFNDWLATRDEIANGHLIHTIRLLKYLRDYKRRPKIKSVILTVLLGRLVESRPTADFEDLPTTFVLLLEDLHRDARAHTGAPYLTEPTCSAVLRLDDTDWAAFTNQVGSLARRAREAYDCERQDGTLARWRELFGDRFPSPTPEKRIVEAALAPGEQDLFRDFGIPTHITERVQMRGKVLPKPGFRHGWIDELGRLGFDRTLRFDVISTTVDEPYTVYWKVKNTGEEARNARQLRGEITRDPGRPASKRESTRFRGDHWVEVYIVKDDVCVARARQDVFI